MSNMIHGYSSLKPLNNHMINVTDEQAATIGGRMAAGKKCSTNVHLRKAAGVIWNDPTLEDWPKNDYRIFCGDLGNEVTDEILANAFKRYPSFQRARVVRDNNSGKTKGYGFVSLLNPDDMLRALKEMNNKFVGNRPIRVMRSKWKDRDINSEKNRETAKLYKVVKEDDKSIRKFKKLGKSVTGGKRSNLIYEPRVFKRHKIYLSTGSTNKLDNVPNIPQNHILDNI
ncbi:RNA binding motif protein 42 [Theileria orientalis strain Shintoku]|uniref:RNA binding motif protein 42 n=1 Tax=Theileria orientalis strain Shintoku TaxID=869250 RepID=J4DP30_THEOR|nr:RNA binding motif protein 42 [Theileria orientalis strain Shintoku]PVC54525.1 RNA binding motif protein 42 [Theileria orientalis]BAM39994.1 RNA binding motif protein 42 [Theileria orientalis strain Shintoku]|eukprot:XP_009690295.1 RNA binding motif protein 42 [Theileria orientalis strain Shintoku]